MSTGISSLTSTSRDRNQALIINRAPPRRQWRTCGYPVRPPHAADGLTPPASAGRGDAALRQGCFVSADATVRPLETTGRDGSPGLLRGVVLLNDLGGNPASIGDVDALVARPLADR